TGVIAGGGVRAVVELAGVRNVLTKCLGSHNPHNMVKATIAALQQLQTPEQGASPRGKAGEELTAWRESDDGGTAIEGDAGGQPGHPDPTPAADAARARPDAPGEDRDPARHSGNPRDDREGPAPGAGGGLARWISAPYRPTRARGRRASGSGAAPAQGSARPPVAATR